MEASLSILRPVTDKLDSCCTGIFQHHNFLLCFAPQMDIVYNLY